MKFTDYQPLARRTMKELPFNQHMEHMGLGVIDEFGEMAAAVKKFFIYGKGVDPKDPSKPMLVKDGGVLDLVNREEEGGDASWYAVGYGPELDLAPEYFQNAFDIGYATGQALSGVGNQNIFIAGCCAQVANAAHALMAESFDSMPEQVRLNCVAIIFRNLGAVYGFFDLDLSRSLERNIAKLKQRHGDKFNAVGAINRDLKAERTILEGGSNADGGIVGMKA